MIEIIVPVRNEEKSVEPMAARIAAAFTNSEKSYKITFVVDPSTDKTLEVLRKIQRKYKHLSIHKKRGAPGKAYSIIEAAQDSGAEYIAMIDGDLQYPPEVLPEMLSIAEEKGIVVGRRVTHNTSFLRKFISKANTFIFGKVLLGLNCDVQSGLKVFRKEIFDNMDLSSIKPWAFDMPLLKTAVDMGFEIEEVDIEFSERKDGTSKVDYISTSLEVALTALRLRLSPSKVYSYCSVDDGPIGNGLMYKRNKYTTHTSLPHNLSAIVTFTQGQKTFIGMLIAFLLAGLVVSPLSTLLAFIGVLTTLYFTDMLFSVFVLLKSLHHPPELTFSDKQISKLEDKDLPLYTVLVPMYKEGDVLEELITNIQSLDWPKSKLEVLLLLEEDDDETQNAAKRIDLPDFMKVVVVPHSMPKTKPKACNYGLAISNGEIVVIYDAEDKPDPLQLKKVYLGFETLPDNVVCLQSKLNYFNPHQNWLTRLFTAEYSLWFDIMLPGLQSIESTIPLGGTSNHFKAKELKAIHGWDPFNVTEDCDLGARLFKAGYKTALVDSTTLEEANSNVKNWLRQRSRWIKGYLQTYLVHMRNPISFFRTHGIHAFTFQLIIGMRISFMVINPFLWATTIAYFAAYKYVGPAIEALYPGWIFYIAVLTLIFGNFLYIYNYMIGCAKRGHYSLIKYVFMVPFYWIMNSISAFIAFYQLIVKPHYWEKTHHGLHLSNKRSAIGLPMELPLKTVRTINKARNITLTSGGALVIASGVANILNLIYNAFLGRALPVVEFGLIALIGNLFSVSSIITSSIGRTVTYKAAYLLGLRGSIEKTFWRRVRFSSFIAGILIVSAWIVAIPFLSRVFQSDSLLPFILFTPIWPISFLTSVDQGFLRGSIKFNTLAALVLIESIVKLIAAILIIELNLSTYVYAAAPIGLVAAFLVGWISITLIKSENTPKSDAEIEDQKFPSIFFGSSILTKLTIITFLSVDVILAKYLLSPVEAGNYALLSLAGKIVYFLGSLFAEFIDPIVSKKLGEGKDPKKSFYGLLSLVSLVSYAGFIIVGLLGKYFMPFVFGEKALAITQYAPVYALGMASFAIAMSVVAYHQIRDNYVLPVIALAFAITEILLIIKFGTNVAAITNIVGFLGTLLLLTVMITHLFAVYGNVLFSNIEDLFDVFKRVKTPKNREGYMNILMFNWRDTKHVWAGGAEEYIHNLGKELVDEGHNVTLFCGNDGKSKRNETIDGVHIIRRGGFYTVYFWAFVYYILKLRRKTDIIIESANGVPFFTQIYSRKDTYLILHHVHQQVFQEHLMFPLNMIARCVEAIIAPVIYRDTKIITVSESSKREISKKLGYNKDNITVITPGISRDIFGTSRKTTQPSFVYIGRHKHYKNIDVAIKAFGLVVKKYPLATFTIGGEGEHTNKLKKLVKKLKLTDSIVFLGKVSEQRKKEVFAQSWVALQPSSFEGWGITVIEANATKTPVIASDVSGLRDSVIEGKTGILVKKESVRAFSTAMINMIENTRMREQFSENAYEWAKNFSWKVSTAKLISLITTNADNEGYHMAVSKISQ